MQNFDDNNLQDLENFNAILDFLKSQDEIKRKREQALNSGNPFPHLPGFETWQKVNAMNNRENYLSGLTQQDEDNLLHGYIQNPILRPIANFGIGMWDVLARGALNLPGETLGALGKASEAIFGGESYLTKASSVLNDWDSTYKKNSENTSRAVNGIMPNKTSNIFHGSGTGTGYALGGLGLTGLAALLSGHPLTWPVAATLYYLNKNLLEAVTESANTYSDLFAQDKSRHGDALLAGLYSLVANAVPDALQGKGEAILNAGLDKVIPGSGVFASMIRHVLSEEANELLQEPRQQFTEEAVKKTFKSGDMSLTNFLHNLIDEGAKFPEYFRQVAPETAASTAITSMLMFPFIGGGNSVQNTAGQETKQQQLIDVRNKLIDERDNVTQRINQIHQSYGNDIDSDADVQSTLNDLYAKQANLDYQINNFWDDRAVSSNPVQDDDLDMFPDRDELISASSTTHSDTTSNSDDFNLDSLLGNINANENENEQNFDDVLDEHDDDFVAHSQNESYSQSAVDDVYTGANNENDLGSFDFKAHSKTYSFNVVSSEINSNDRLTRMIGQRRIDIRSKGGKVIASFYPNSGRFDFSDNTARKHSPRWKQKFQHDFLNNLNGFLQSAGWLDNNGNLLPDGNENFRNRWNERFQREGVDGRNAFYSNEIQPEDFDDEVSKSLNSQYAPQNTNQINTPQISSKKVRIRNSISGISDWVAKALGLPVFHNETYNQSSNTSNNNQTVGFYHVNDNGQNLKLSVETAQYPDKYNKQKLFFGRFFNIKDQNGRIVARYAPYTGNLQLADNYASESIKQQIEAFISRNLNDYLSKGGFIDENGKLISDGNEHFRHQYRTRLDTTPEGRTIHPNNQRDSSPIDDNRSRKQRLADNEAEKKSFQNVKLDIQRKIEAMFNSWFDKAKDLNRELYHALPRESAEYYATIYAARIRAAAHAAGMRIADLYKVWNLRFDFVLQDTSNKQINRGDVEMNPAGYDDNNNFHPAEKIIKTYGHIQDIVLHDDNGNVLRDENGKPITRKFLVINSDASTLLHEGSHIFLEDFRELMTLDNLPQQVQYDWAKLIKWLGVADIDLTKDKSQRTQDEQRRWENAQEKFAVAMEQYCAKGKAPNTWLKRIFKAFKSWLSDIYSAVKNIKYMGTDKRTHEIEIPREIRRVFDRLLQDNKFVPNEANREARFARAGQTGQSEAHNQTSLGKQNSIRDVLDVMHTELGRKNSGNVWVDYARVSKEEAERISNATGLDISDRYVHSLSGEAVAHVEKRHGLNNEQRQDQLPINDADFERIPDIIHNPDEISRGNEKTTGNTNDTVVYKKRINGHVLVVEEVRTKRGKLAFHTMRKSKAGYDFDLSRDGHPIVKKYTASEGITSGNDLTPEVQFPNAHSNNILTPDTSNSKQKTSIIRRSNDSFISQRDIQQFEQLAYHGTGHIILNNHFDLKFMGKGEGAQVYGYGIYLAQAKDVAQTYRHYGIPHDKSKTFTIRTNNDQSFVLNYLSGIWSGHPEKYILDVLRDFRRKQRFTLNGKSLDDIKSSVFQDYKSKQSDLIRDLQNAKNMAETSDSEDERKSYSSKILSLQKDIETLYKKNIFLQSISDFSIERVGNIYEADIPENDVLLDWDASLDEQPQKVKRALKKVIAHVQQLGGDIDISELREATDGKDFYLALKHIMQYIMADQRLYTKKTGIIKRADMAASLMLNQAGIPGLRYLDKWSRYSDDYNTHNFVIWNTDLIQITGIDESSDKDAKEYFNAHKKDNSESFNQPIINEFRTEAGHSVEEADPSELLLSPYGSTSFGVIDSRTANIAGIHEGNIVIDVQGLMHTKLNKHNREIVNAGYPNVETFFFDVLRHYDRIYQGSNDSLLLAKALNKHNGVAAIELLPDNNGTYLVKTGWIIRDRGLKNRKLLFSRSEPYDISPVTNETLQTPSKNTGENASHASLKSNSDSLSGSNPIVNISNSEIYNQPNDDRDVKRTFDIFKSMLKRADPYRFNPDNLAKHNHGFISDDFAERFNQPAYNGTGRILLNNNFDLSKIGEGEGNSYYGWGAYFAQNKAVSESYRRFGRKDNQNGNLYIFDLPENDVLLNWDIPLSQQPEHVKKAIGKLYKIDFLNNGFGWDITGSDLYREITNYFIAQEIADDEALFLPLSNRWRHDKHNQKKTSMLFNKLGVPGLRFFDKGSRKIQQGTHNFVIWNQEAIKLIGIDPSSDQDAIDYFNNHKAQQLNNESYHQTFNIPFNPNELKTESGNSIDLAHSSELLLTPDGSPALGHIDHEIALSAGIQEGEIHANIGVLRHAEQRHGKQIRKAGYPNVQTFLLDVLNNWSDIRESSNNSFWLIAPKNEGHGAVAAIRLQQGKNGIYRVATLLFARDRAINSKRLLFSGRPSPDSSSGSESNLARAAYHTSGTSAAKGALSEELSLSDSLSSTSYNVNYSNSESFNQFISPEAAKNLDSYDSSNFRTDNLRLAKHLASIHKPQKNIWLATGWILSPTGEWKYEIPDGQFIQRPKAKGFKTESGRAADFAENHPYRIRLLKSLFQSLKHAKSDEQILDIASNIYDNFDNLLPFKTILALEGIIDRVRGYTDEDLQNDYDDEHNDNILSQEQIDDWFNETLENEEYVSQFDDNADDESGFDEAQAETEYEAEKDLLKNFFNAPELFKAYPQLETFNYYEDNLGLGVYGTSSFGNDHLGQLLGDFYVNSNLNNEQARSVLIYQIQRAIQAIEGFYKIKKTDNPNIVIFSDNSPRKDNYHKILSQALYRHALNLFNLAAPKTRNIFRNLIRQSKNLSHSLFSNLVRNSLNKNERKLFRSLYSTIKEARKIARNPHNPSYMSKYVQFIDLSHEIEAREAQHRRNWDLGKRRANMPDFTNLHHNYGDRPLHRILNEDTESFNQIIGIGGAKRLDEAEGVSWRTDNLKIARRMDRAKSNNNTIWAATGWIRGADKKWRMEIPDGKIIRDKLNELRKNSAEFQATNDKLRNNPDYVMSSEELDRYKVLENFNATLQTFFDAPQLFNAYPDARYILVDFANLDASTYASYDTELDTISINKNIRNLHDLKSALIHEIQHAVQSYEGFAHGASYSPDIDTKLKRAEANFNRALQSLTTSSANKVRQVLDTEFFGDKNNLPHMTAQLSPIELNAYHSASKALHLIDKRHDTLFSRYERHAGEVEARNTETRAYWSDKRRRNTPLDRSEDVPRNEQIIGRLYKKKSTNALETFNQSQLGDNYNILALNADGHNVDINAPDTQLNKVRTLYEGTDQWLKAPNGKKSNLNVRQWLLVRTPAFKRWFGDWENHP